MIEKNSLNIGLDYSVFIIAYFCKKLGLSGLTESVDELCTNKFIHQNHFNYRKHKKM